MAHGSNREPDQFSRLCRKAYQVDVKLDLSSWLRGFCGLLRSHAGAFDYDSYADHEGVAFRLTQTLCGWFLSRQIPVGPVRVALWN